MPKARLQDMRSIPNTRPPNMTLNLECYEEPLNEAQMKCFSGLKENYERVSATLEELVKDHGGKLVCQAGNVNGYQYTLPANPAQALVKNNPQSIVNVSQSKTQPIKLNVLNNANVSQGNIQLVVDSRMGVILGSVAQGTAMTNVSSIPTIASGSTSITTATTSTSQTENYKYTRSGRRTKVLQLQQPDVIEEPPVVNLVKPIANSTHVVTPTSITPQGVTNLRIKTVNKPPVIAPAPSACVSTPTGTVTVTLAQARPMTKPSETSCIGGISIGKNTVPDQVDESKKNLPDGREVTFNKGCGGRTFPSLVVVARPNLHIKDITPQIAQKERSELDVKVKGVLMFSPTRFTEWLLQQGLIKSEQYCIQHGSNNSQRSKLKLGMYSEQGTFPYSGGYVWIASCCPDRFVSVFAGSIFEGAPHTPTVLLKLIYHWACQTSVSNVVSWVKVSNVYVKNFYTHLRSVCTATICDKSRKMGGRNSVIQVGVISLGTTSQDGNSRQVKVEVLGVLDYSTLELRLRACDPVQDSEKSYKRRFNNILHPLKDWVHTDSKIMTDFTVDKNTLEDMGFHLVTQSAFAEQTPRNFNSNFHIMEYLRKIVPRMFQNTLSLLSRQMIQQFLDELVWREMYGATAARAFDNMIAHIAEQIKVDTKGESFIERLAKITANPFQNWSYSNVTPPPLTPLMTINEALLSSSSDVMIASNSNIKQSQEKSLVPEMKPGPKKKRKRWYTTIVPSSELDSKRSTYDPKSIREKDRENKTEQIPLQEYYYATLEGDKNMLLQEYKSSIYFKCSVCPTTMRSNTEVMEHTITHVPAQIPGQSKSPACRYCCTAFSSQHQVTTHVAEAHSNFGHSDSDMVACAICEQKFGNAGLLINHMSSMHCPSEMPYRCETCNYRTSSHKDAIDHYYSVHEKGAGLQCPYCMKVIVFIKDGNPCATNIHAFLSHMQRHIIRKEQGQGNKCSRCSLWFNQKSAFKNHQMEMHNTVSDAKVVPYKSVNNKIMMAKPQPQNRRFDIDSPLTELPDEKIARWTNGPIVVNVSMENLSCKECEEDIDEENHYPGEQKCPQCRYVTCCWRTFKEHMQKIHNERPMTSQVVPSPLINIPLDKEMQCSCGYVTVDGNQLATHLVKCKKVSAYLVEDAAPSGIMDSLGLVPKNSSDEIDIDIVKRIILH